jgi:large conductance mechanosensitive channel
VILEEIRFGYYQRYFNKMSSSKIGQTAMSFLQDFRDFAMKGPVIDLAIGVIIGAAFGKIVSSLVTYVVMPPIGLLLGRVDFSSLFINLSGKPAASLKEATDKGLAVLAYGAFLNTVVEFLIVAFVLFIVIQQANRFRKPAPPKGPSGEEKLLAEIRDLLKAERGGPGVPEKPAA